MTGSCPVSALVCQETARERNELRAEVERLRAGIEALADWWQRTPGDGGYEVACKDHARQVRALIDPTEGDRDD